MNLPPIIGISGKSGSGKSTVAAHLVLKHGYRQLAFAGALKDMLQNAFCLTDDHLDGHLKEEVIPRLGKSARWLMQHFGTAFREVWSEIWLYHLENHLLKNTNQPAVVVDVRFPNEAQLLKSHGALLIRLERPGHHGAPSGLAGHCSEIALDDYSGWDAVITSAEGPEAVCTKVEKVLKLSPWGRHECSHAQNQGQNH